MADPRLGPRPAPPPALVVLGAIAADPELGREAAEAFAAPWGGVRAWGPPVPFTQSPYYEPELGPDLRRTFCACARLAPADGLPELKEQAWAVEQRYLAGGRRRVNLDPGLLDHARVVLASFKEGPRKLYLGRGVWADLVLSYGHGAFGPLPWTFPDLREGPHVDFFAEARREYKTLLRGG